MGRYTGPSCRLCRRSGEKLFLKGDRCFSPKCAVERKSRPPGMVSQRRRRLSERGIQLREKQKVKWMYGIMEGQFHRLYETARKRPGVTGQYLLQLLERRLDNVVYRLGFADSRKQARQLVTHGHFTLNGKRMDIPSYIVKEGDTVTWRERSTKNNFFQAMKDSSPPRPVPGWLNLDKGAFSGKVQNLPQPSDLDVKIEDRYIVEYYSR